MVNAKEQTEYLMLLMVEKQLIKTKVKKLRLVGILRFGLSQPFLSISPVYSMTLHAPYARSPLKKQLGCRNIQHCNTRSYQGTLNIWSKLAKEQLTTRQ